SCEGVVEPDELSTPVVTLPSSSNRPSGTGSELGRPAVLPKMPRGTTARTVIVAVGPAGRGASVAVSSPPLLMEPLKAPVYTAVQVNSLGSGRLSVTTTLVAGPAPVFETVIVKEAVSPGWIVLANPGLTALAICTLGSKVTLVEAGARMILLKFP